LGQGPDQRFSPFTKVLKEEERDETFSLFLPGAGFGVYFGPTGSFDGRQPEYPDVRWI
jgi:hypothetical protein